MTYVLAQVSPGVLGWVWAELRPVLDVYTEGWGSRPWLREGGQRRAQACF